MSEKPYRIQSHYKPDKVKRARKSVHSSRLPYWLARQPLVQKFNRLSRKRKFALIAFTIASFLVLLALFTTIYFANTLGSKERIMNRNKTGVTLFDQNDKVFYKFYNASSNTHVPLAKISKPVKEAVIASEDKDFYEHAGFSPRGIASAVWQNIRPDGINSGGSTITQQLVKTALLSEERSYIRKYQELVLSIEIERRYSKDEILEMYLNSVYFGEGAFGIEDAAKIYFNKSAKDLNVAQSSLLIGLLPAPSAYSPISGDVEKAKQRQTYVLDRMEEDGYITTTQEESAHNAALTYSKVKTEEDTRAPHFALMVKEELEDRYGEEKIARSGYSVKTTLNLDWQSIAEAAVAQQVDSLQFNNVSNGSAVIIDPRTGEIRALVGSKDWNNEAFGKFNITTATRQPGSSFKPFVYATGIENKVFSAATLLQDKPTDFGGGYKPENYNLGYRGDVTVRESLANSLNIPAVQALQKTGIDSTIEMVNKLGLTTIKADEDYGLSLALGSAPAKLTEMTNAYATFANKGERNDITTIFSISDKNRKEIFNYEPEPEEALSEQTSYIMSSIMSDPIARSQSFGSSLTLDGGRPGAVKTGTTEDYRDAWTIGYTPSMTVGVWIGNNDNSPMSSVAGSSGAAPIWRSIMNQTLANTPNENFEVENFEVPGSITVRSVCRGNGALAETNSGNTLTEYFIPGTLPTRSCNEPKPVEPKPEPKADKPRQQKPEEIDETPVDKEEGADGDGEDNPDGEPNQNPPTVPGGGGGTGGQPTFPQYQPGN